MLGIAGCDNPKPPKAQASATNIPTLPTVAGQALDRSHKGAAMPAMPFAAPGGAPATLGSFRGHPVLVNLWATWCGPCVKELPSLDALAQRDKGKLAVVAVSQDMGGDKQVQPFLKAHGIKTLAGYTDAKNELMTAMGAGDLPTTILYNARGHEVWRASGGMDWTGPEATKLLAEGE